MSYPFAAVVGNSNVKRALLLLAVDRNLRGVLIAAGRGSAKSVLARAAESIFQSTTFQLNPHPPFIELPIGVTGECLQGGLDLERSLISGKRQNSKGLIAQADGGALYVDNMNLLEPRIAIQLASALEAKAAQSETEDLTDVTGADFVFIGTYDREEGEVNSLLRARVGLFVEGETLSSLDDRAEVIRRVSEYQRDAAGLISRFDEEMKLIRKDIRRARKSLPEVKIADKELRQISKVALALGVEGHQADVFAARVAKAHAALCQRQQVHEEDLIPAIQLVLLPRATCIPSDFEIAANASQPGRPGDPEEVKTPNPAPENHIDASDSAKGDGDASDSRRERNRSKPAQTSIDQKPDQLQPARPSGASVEDLLIQAIDAQISQGALQSPVAGRQMRQAFAKGKPTQKTKRKGPETSSLNQGRPTRHTAKSNRQAKIAVAATLGAAAPFQLHRRIVRRDFDKALKITAKDLRYQRFKQRKGILFIFAIDASGSMAINRLAQVKGAMTRLLQEAYIYRDKVALISFRKQTAEVLLPPTRSVELAKRVVDAIPAGGATPLAAALVKALAVAEQAHSQNISQSILLLFTDGRANVALRKQETSEGATGQESLRYELRRIGQRLRRSSIRILVIDTKPKFLAGGEAKDLAETLEAEYLYLPRADDKSIHQSLSGVAQRLRDSN